MILRSLIRAFAVRICLKDTFYLTRIKCIILKLVMKKPETEIPILVL